MITVVSPPPAANKRAWEEVIHTTWHPERVLPWAHLEGPLPPATLAKHRLDALGEAA
jgi:hypothetical protein